MSIAGLSYGVVRVEEAGSITSLTLQDVGIVMPGGMLLLLSWLQVTGGGISWGEPERDLH